MNARYSSAGSSLSPRARILSRNSRPTSSLNTPSFAKARERVRVQHFGPFVGVVAGAVPHRAREQVRESGDHGMLRRASGAAENSAESRACRPTASPFARSHLAMRSARSTKPKPKLPHLRIGGPESPRPLHLLEQVLGHRLARLPVPREQVQRLALPAPVLHDLRRQLHEVPGHARARQAAHLHPAQQWCSRWPNSWKIVSTSRCVSSAGLPSTGGVRLPHINPRCGLPSRQVAGDERVHPGAAALVLARVPVGIEGPQSADRRASCSDTYFTSGSHTGAPLSSRTGIPEAYRNLKHPCHHCSSGKYGRSASSSKS